MRPDWITTKPSTSTNVRFIRRLDEPQPRNKPVIVDVVTAAERKAATRLPLLDPVKREFAEFAEMVLVPVLVLIGGIVLGVLLATAMLL